jgi:hypothetical protein
MRNLALTLGNLSDMLGGSSVMLGSGNGWGPNTLLTLMVGPSEDPRPAQALKEGIYVEVAGFGTRVYTLSGSDLLLTLDVGTPKRPRVETYRVDWEEPVAFLLEHTSRHDNFKDATENFSYDEV